MTPTTPPGRILVVCDDLFFWSRVRAALGAGSPVAVRVASEAEMERAWSDGGVRSLVADLSIRGIDLPRWARRWKSRADPPELVGFYAHVDEEASRAAREAGFDRVVPRSRFARDPARYLSPASDDPSP